MSPRISFFARPWLVWLLTLVALPFWMANDGPLAWDLNVILDAVHSVHAGADPYLAGIANQDAFLQSAAHLAGAPRPFVYVYSPFTLPLLKLMGMAPAIVVKTVYWSAYILALLLQMWVVSHFPHGNERLFVGIVTPMMLFFPGLLLFDTVFSGNIAFILYGLILGSFLIGWKHGRWRWFYLAVLLASCFKAPYLIYLAIPLFCVARHGWNVAASSVVGLSLFGLQALVCPVAFHNYMRALDRIFSYNNDFGSSPAGRLGAFLALGNGRYALWGTMFYLVFSLSLFITLLYLSRHYKNGVISAEQWFPLMFIGVLLMTPRLMEYDIFPFTVPMALIVFRVFRLIRPLGFAHGIAACLLALWLVANYFAANAHETWKYIECGVLLVIFSAGCWQLLFHSSTVPAAVAQPAD